MLNHVTMTKIGVTTLRFVESKLTQRKKSKNQKNKDLLMLPLKFKSDFRGAKFP